MLGISKWTVAPQIEGDGGEGEQHEVLRHEVLRHVSQHRDYFMERARVGSSILVSRFPHPKLG
jgi:hypothetical protein